MTPSTHCRHNARPGLQAHRIAATVVVLTSCLATCPLADAQLTDVDVELNLLVDVSGSIDASEFNLQRSGYANAFRDPNVQRIIASHPNGVAVGLTYWSSSNEQRTAVPYTHLTDAASAFAFADAIDAAARPFNGGTRIGPAIDHAAESFASNDFSGSRWVIDVSGDGTSDPSRTASARDQALAAGVTTINGLTIGGSSIEAFYRDYVIGGSDAFVRPVSSFDDLDAAVREKLSREIIDAPPQQPQPDLGNPPASTSQYNFLVGAQPSFQWDGFTVGFDFSLSIPTLNPIEYHPSVTYPETPFAPQLDPWEVTFGTNNWLLGSALSTVAPVDFNALTLSGLARLRGEVAAIAGVFLEDTEDHAVIGAALTGGLFLDLSLEAQSGLLDVLPNKLQDLVPTTLDFTYPIAGASISTPEAPVSIGYQFDVDEFIQGLAALTGEPVGHFEGTVDVLGLPMNFLDLTGDDNIDNVSVTVGASATLYAETSATAGLDFYFYEVDSFGTPIGGTSIFDAWSGVWNQAIEIAQDTVIVSATGEVAINDVDGLFTMTTGSPVWLSTVVQVTDETNLLALAVDFLSDAGAEGLLQIYWDGELVATVDERNAADALQSYVFALDGRYEDGFHQLAFRLDSFTETASSVQIGNLTTGFLATVPESSTFGLLMTFAVVQFGCTVRRRGQWRRPAVIRSDRGTA